MSEIEETAMTSETIQDKKEESPTLPHSLKKGEINMTVVLMKMIEVIACLEGNITSERMEQSDDPSISIDCIIKGHAYDFSFSKAQF